jgi:hypothetical protein
MGSLNECNLLILLLFRIYCLPIFMGAKEKGKPESLPFDAKLVALID